MRTFQFTKPPLDLIAEKREDMSSQLRKIVDKPQYGEQRHWLSVWIREYDKAIKAIKEASDE